MFAVDDPTYIYIQTNCITSSPSESWLKTASFQKSYSFTTFMEQVFGLGVPVYDEDMILKQQKDPTYQFLAPYC